MKCRKEPDFTSSSLKQNTSRAAWILCANLLNSRGEMAGKIIKATGGGAYKYTKLLQEKLGLK
jgi:pantothenate kinase